MRIIVGFFCFIFISMTNAQNMHIRSLSELINTTDPAWPMVTTWIQNATNKVQVLPKDAQKADSALVLAQVTTRSPMGAVIYETGGILIDNGWIRILGSGSPKLNRSLMEWNKGKSFSKNHEAPSFLLVADDVLGGFFAINAGGLSSENGGKIFYFAPDNLSWECLNIGYSEFLNFCFCGDIAKFYDGFRWNAWEQDVLQVNGCQGMSCFPFLWTQEGKDINRVSRKIVPIQELWDLHCNRK